MTWNFIFFFILYGMVMILCTNFYSLQEVLQRVLHVATELERQESRTNHIPAEEVDATNRLSSEVVRREVLLLPVVHPKFPLVAGVFPAAAFDFMSEEQLESCVNVLMILELMEVGEELTETLSVLLTLPTWPHDPAVVVDIDREVTLDMENIEARSRNGFLPVSFLLGFVTGTVPPVRTLPAELPPPPPPPLLPPTPSSADDLDWSAGSGDCWPDTADPTDTDSSNTIASDTNSTKLIL